MKIFALKRNQIIISALVVMIAVAGYLNYIDSSARRGGEEIALNGDGEVSALVVDAATGQELTVVNAVYYEEYGDGEIAIWPNIPEEYSDWQDGAPEPGEAVFVNTSSDTSYFVQAKLEREQSRSRQKQTLNDLINNDNIDNTQKADCASALLTIQDRVEKESATEAMIESKGFREVYVRIDDMTIDVIVNKPDLTDIDIAQIEDIVKRKAGVTSEQIRISPLKQ